MDDCAGIVGDVDIVTGEEPDHGKMAERLSQIAPVLGLVPGTVTADAGYGAGQVCAEMERRQIDPVIPHRPVTRRQGSSGYPMDRCKYDQPGDIVRCPSGKILTPRSETPTGRWFRAETSACKTCPLRADCIPGTAPTRRVPITRHCVVILRARRRRLAWVAADRRLYTRQRWLVEGVHGLAKTLHGLNQAVRSGLANLKIQAVMTTPAVNLKRLAEALLLLLVRIRHFRYTKHPQAA